MKTSWWMTLLGAIALVGCNGDGVPKEEYDQAISDQRKLKLQVEDLETQLKKAEEEAEAATPAKADASELDQKIDELLMENETKDAEIDKLKEEFRAYKSKYRLTIRGKLIGQEVAMLHTAKGDFEQVVVKEITAVGLRISHKGGTGRLRFEDLDEALQDQLGYDEEEAAEILAKELAERAEKEKALAAARAAQAPTEEEKERNSRADNQREYDRLKAFLARANTQYRTLRREALNYEAKHKFAKSRGRVSYWDDKAQAAHRRANALKLDITAADKRRLELQRALRG